MKLIHSALSRVTGVLLLAGAILVPYPGHAQTNLVVLARDGAWTWYNDPRALFHNGTLYFGYVRHGDGRTVLSAFNPRTATTTDLWTSTLTERDDHNVPGLLVRNDGRMLALYARHNTDLFFNYRLSTSTSPDTPEQWGPEQRSADTAARMTYANPVQLSGESNLIYNFARNLNFNPTVFTSRDGGATWSEPMIYFRSGSGSVRPYVKIASDGRRRIDFLYTDGHPRDVTNSLYHLYYESGVFRKTDGTAVGYFTNLPLDLDRGVSGSVIYQYSTEPQPDWNQWIPRGRAWCWEIVNGTGGPVCVFTVRLQGVAGPNWRGNRIYYYYARWTGTEWQKRLIAQAGRPLYDREGDYAGGICIDPENPNVVYISSNAREPFALGSAASSELAPDERYEIWRGITSDGGLTFKWEPVTTNSSVDNLRPYIPRGHQGRPALLWFRGHYRAYTSFQTEVVGLFSTELPLRAPGANAP